MIDVKRARPTRVIQDIYDTPGNKYLYAGDTEAGFFGFVQASTFITGDALATAIGLSSGTSQNSDAVWIKYIWKGKICFVPLKTHRHSVTWDAIYNAGALFGSGDEGILPPTGRMGETLSIDSTDNSINISTHFLGDLTSATDYADVVADVGDTVVLKGWSNSSNNGEFTVGSITDNKMVLSGGTLVSENGNRLGKIYKKAKAITQNATVTIDGKTYKVRLMRGASNNPLDSSDDADRDGIGEENEWNSIMLPLHERAKLQNWNYSAYVGTTDDWNIYLTDKDMNTDYALGNGSYSWCQEVKDITSWKRVFRGYSGVSSLIWSHSWIIHSYYGFRPVLELVV